MESLLRGIPHCIILSNSNRELSVLVPNIRPVRPRIVSSPFSTEIIIDRLTDEGRKWTMNVQVRTRILVFCSVLLRVVQFCSFLFPFHHFNPFHSPL